MITPRKRTPVTKSRVKKKDPAPSDWVALEVDEEEDGCSVGDVLSGDEVEEDQLLDEGEEVDSDIDKLNVRCV